MSRWKYDILPRLKKKIHSRTFVSFMDDPNTDWNAVESWAAVGLGDALQQGRVPQFPHCDTKVLHAPGECTYCDRHEDWQILRHVWGINFTGHHDPSKLTCPAEIHRSITNIENWGGNVPVQNGQYSPRVDPEELERTTKHLLELLSALEQTNSVRKRPPEQDSPQS